MNNRNLYIKARGAAIASEKAFVISVKTDNPGTSLANQFTVPTTGIGYAYTIQTSDGQTITANTGDKTITFPSAGTYDLKITGNFPRIYFNNGGDRLKLIDIKNWGIIFWTSMENAFFGCNSITTLTATDAPNLTNVISLSGMFSTCRNLLKIDVRFWDVSTVKNMFIMFIDCNVLNSLGVDNWDTSKVTDMGALFNRCNNINPEVQNWNTSSVISVSNAFKQNNSFNRSLSNWDISKVTNMTGLLESASGMSTVNYDSTLISWANQTPKMGISTSFGGSKYTLGGSAAAARQTLISTYEWTIVDGGGI
jgi:surface protein